MGLSIRFLISDRIFEFDCTITQVFVCTHSAYCFVGAKDSDKVFLSISSCVETLICSVIVIHISRKREDGYFICNRNRTVVFHSHGCCGIRRFHPGCSLSRKCHTCGNCIFFCSTKFFCLAPGC